MADGKRSGVPRSVKSAQRRRLISKVATEQIAARGFENLSVNDLATAVGISVGGMYRYISSKTDLLVMACEDIYDGVRDEIGVISTGSESIEERLRAAVVAYLGVCMERREQISMVYREYRKLPAADQATYKQREQAIVDVFADMVRAGVRAGRFRDVDAMVVAVDIVYAGHLPAFKWWALHRSVSAEGLCQEQAELILASLRPD